MTSELDTLPKNEQTSSKESDIKNHSKLFNSDNIAKWLSTAFALITAGLGGKDVLYQKLFLPYTQPINIKVSPEVSEINILKTNDQNTRQINIKTTVTNLGQSKVSLLKPHWIIYGHMNGEEANDRFNLPNKEKPQVLKNLSNVDDQNLSRIDINPDHKERVEPNKNKSNVKEFLGMGPLFSVSFLNPQGIVEDNRVVVVPRYKGMRYLEIVINVPTLSQYSILDTKSSIRWKGIPCQNQADCTKKDEGKAYKWLNTYCESLPFKAESSKDVTPDTILNVYIIKPFKMIESYDKKIHNFQPKYCENTSIDGLTLDEAIKLGARVFTTTHELALDAKKETIRE